MKLLSPTQQPCQTAHALLRTEGRSSRAENVKFRSKPSGSFSTPTIKEVLSKALTRLLCLSDGREIGQLECFLMV